VRKSNSHFFSKTECQRALVAAGFSLKRGKQGDTSGSIRLWFDGQWLQLVSESALNVSDPLVALMGDPGLWKFVTNKKGHLLKVFEFPLDIVSERCPDPEESSDVAKSSLATIFQWARDTLNGQRLNGWHRPAGQELMELLAPRNLTVQCGRFARQAELICKPKRLALRLPLIFCVSDDLPDIHYAWLRKLLIDAQDRWKLVRIGFRDDSSKTAVQAEVDLTGAPHSVLAGLLSVASAALRAVATWVIPSAEFLAEQTTDIWALKVHGDDSVECHTKKKGGD
jgi:hypothetical protein